MLGDNLPVVSDGSKGVLVALEYSICHSYHLSVGAAAGSSVA